ncbi:hypothetical protein GQ53DRAFT_742244 [Thozetella sp. PMI_491]|nr:hypothetical protein GQ53DRAFT_742244 [Thozetella sp. PMI_491]
MFAVIFEVRPDASRFDAYLDVAKALRPELEGIEGFKENLRYKSIQRPGLLLSLSTWADEKALVRWRTRGRHHLAQEKGRGGIFEDYHLRVGQIVHGGGQGWQATELGVGNNERFDETVVGQAKTVVLIDGFRTDADGGDLGAADDLARRFGLNVETSPQYLVDWDILNAVLTPGDLILLTSWSNEQAAASFCEQIPPSLRYRRVRIIRDYGKYDRREAPQYYKDAEGRETIH